MGYFSNLGRGITTTIKGLKLTFRHLLAARNSKNLINIQDENYFEKSGGYVTLQYPHEHLHIPDHGRNQLECEIDDCIVCDKCAKICPVNCIDILAIKSPEIIRTTSDGSPVRLYAEKFDIDLAKCCFCGLCTTVCPTDCLTMNNKFAYSVSNVNDLNFAFSNLSAPEAEEKKILYQQYVEEKQNLTKKPESKIEKVENPVPKKPIFAPKLKPNFNNIELEKPKFIPKLKPNVDNIEPEKPKFIPKIKPNVNNIEPEKPKFIPKLKPKTNE